ncbi:MAG: TMEM175 family protein [Thermoplasmata archaeon]
MREGDEAPSGSNAPSGPWKEPPGDDLSRILALSDGIFAFAMTLLVLNLTGLAFLTCGSASTPCSGGNLLSGLAGNASTFVGYVLVFFVVALYWTVHHRIFRYIERYDSTLMWLNLLFLIFIAIMPFVLEVLNVYSSTTAGVVFFAGFSAITGLLLATMFRHASGPARLVDARLPDSVRHELRRRGLVIPLVFVLSIPIAFVSPMIATYCWGAAFPASILLRRYAVG